MSSSQDQESDFSSYDSEKFGILINEGLMQMYIVLAAEFGEDSNFRHVFYSDGHYSYEGHLDLPLKSKAMELKEVPKIIPLIKDLYDKLTFVSETNNLPRSCQFRDIVHHLVEVAQFIAEEFSKEKIIQRVERLSKEFSWIEEDSCLKCFEMKTVGSASLAEVEAIAMKVYVRSLTLNVFYIDASYYVVLEENEKTELLLEDTRFPDVSSGGPCVLLRSYNDPELKQLILRCYTLTSSVNDKLPTEDLNLQKYSYEQTYCVLKGEKKTFTLFQSACYAGSFQMDQELRMDNFSALLPKLRAQVEEMHYIGEVSELRDNDLPYLIYLDPITSFLRTAEIIRGMLINCDHWLEDLLKELQVAREWIGDTVTAWLEGDGSAACFEFQTSGDPLLKSVEFIAFKAFISDVTIAMMYLNGSYYVTIQQADGNEQQLIDSTFPSVSSQGRGYMIQAFPHGTDDFPCLRKLSLWQTSSNTIKGVNEHKDEELLRSKIVSTGTRAPEHTEKSSTRASGCCRNEEKDFISLSRDTVHESGQAQPVTAAKKNRIPYHVAPMTGNLPKAPLPNIAAPWDRFGRNKK